jgi:hypothetical protein
MRFIAREFSALVFARASHNGPRDENFAVASVIAVRTLILRGLAPSPRSTRAIGMMRP